MLNLIIRRKRIMKTINKIIKWFLYGSEVKIYPLPKINETHKKQAEYEKSKRIRNK